MRDFLHSTKFKIIIVVLAIIVGLMLYSATRNGEISGAENAMGTALSPLQKLSQTI